MPTPAEQPLRVLICDDHPETADMLAAVLELAGCTTETAQDAEGALAAARVFRPDVAILDLQLRGPLNGFDLACALRSDAQLDDLVLVAFSGHVSQADRLAAYAAGFDRFIAKPAQPVELLATLPYVQPAASQRAPH